MTNNSNASKTHSNAAAESNSVHSSAMSRGGAVLQAASVKSEGAPINGGGLTKNSDSSLGVSSSRQPTSDATISASKNSSNEKVTQSAVSSRGFPPGAGQIPPGSQYPLQGQIPQNQLVKLENGQRETPGANLMTMMSPQSVVPQQQYPFSSYPQASGHPVMQNQLKQPAQVNGMPPPGGKDVSVSRRITKLLPFSMYQQQLVLLSDSY